MPSGLQMPTDSSDSHPRQRRLRLAIVLSACLILLGSLGVYTVALLLSESVYTQRGTYAYFVCISPTIKHVPNPQSLGDVRFYHTPGDGPKLPQDEVSFMSAAPREVIYQQIENYLFQLGYEKLEGRANAEGQSYLREDSSVDIRIESIDAGTHKVTVTETF
jgi:hypothetical protein